MAATDEELVSRARQGEVRAFETLVARHEGRVLRVLGHLGVSAEDREDVAQEVLMRVFRYLGSFDRRRSFGAWIYRMTVNAAHDHRSRHGRRAREEAPWAEGLERADEGPGPDETARERDLRVRLAAALEALSERERAVFVLRELEGLETKEVARTLGVTSITVRRHLGRARRRLQRAFEGEKSSRRSLGVERPAVRGSR